MSPAGVRARHLVDLGRFVEAREVITTALATDPDDARLHGLMAQAHLGLDDADRALVHANRAVACRPDDEWGHRLASIALSRRGMVEESVRAATEAVRLAPLNWLSHQALALAASQHWTTRADSARAARQAVALAPGEPGAHFVVGLVAQRRGERQAAVAAYEEVLRLQPDHAEALNNLTVVRDQRRLGAAARGYGGSLQIDPHSAIVRRNVELLALRFLRRVYFGALIAVAVGALASVASDGRVGAATLTVAALTVVIVATYAAVVLHAVPAGVRRYVAGRVARQPFSAFTLALTAAMLVLALAICVVPDGYAFGLSLLPALGAANLGLAIWARSRRIAR